MTELNSLSLNSSGQVSQLSDDLIDRIEDFLLYSVDSEIPNHIFKLVQFFTRNLTNFFRTTTLSYSEQHYQKRLLRAMRFFRHSFLDTNLSRQLEDIAFSYLRTPNSGNTQQLAFVFLVDHFLTDPNSAPENCSQLISWSMDFVNSTMMNISSQTITENDKNLYLTIIYSIANLFSLFPQFLMKRIVQYQNSLIDIAIRSVQFLKQPNFSDDLLAIIAAKSLKLCYQLIIQYRKISSDTISYLSRLDKLLSSDEISFSHIYQNYLMVTCSIIQIDVSIPPEMLSELSKNTIPFLVRNFQYFIQMPISQSKKISFFLKTVAKWLSKTNTRSVANLVNILPNLWNLASSFHGQIKSITVIGEIIRNLISLDLLRDNPIIHHTLIENLVSSLEIVRLDVDSIDFTKPNRQFETDNWLECNKQIIALIYNIIHVDSRLMQQANIYYSTIRINTLVRFVKYICYLLDLAASVANQNETETPLSTTILHQIHFTEFRDKMTYIFDFFVPTLNHLSQPLFNHVLSLTMFDLLPKQQQRYFHKHIFAQFLKLLKGPYLFDFETIFFTTITDHFDELFLPTPPSILLVIIQIVFKTIFSDDNPIQMDQISTLSIDLYRFIIKAISSKNATLLELLLTMFHSYFKCKKVTKFESLINIISSSPFLMSNVLRVLSEYPSLKNVVSFLSLFLFPLCNMQQQINQQQLIEPWIHLFLPSLESPTRLSTAIPALFNYTSKSFAQLITTLKDQVQSVFVTSLITPLSKIQKKRNLKILLGKIPEITCRLSLQAQNPKKKKNNYVLVGGFQVDIEIIFEAMKRKSSPSEKEMNTLFESYCQFLASLSFFDATNETLVEEISEYIQKNSPKLLETMHLKFQSTTQYAALFLRQKYSLPIDDIEVDDPDTFLQHIATLCYSRSTANEALQVISLHLDNVDNPSTLSKLNSALLRAAQFDDRKAFDIISNQILNRDFSDKPDLQNEIIQHYRLASMDILTTIRRTAIKLIVISEEKFKITDLMANYRQEIFKNINSIFQNQPFSRFEFIFSKPFTDVPDPLDMVLRLMDYLRGKPVPIISKEVQLLIKKLNWTDFKIAPYINAKFIIKMIAKLILVAENMSASNWVYLIQTFKDDTTVNLRQFVPYFIKQLRKGAKPANKTVFNSLPNTLSGLVSILGTSSLPNNREDLKIIRFLLDFSPFKIQLDQHHQQLVMQLRLQMKPQINQQIQYQQMQNEIIQFTNIINSVIISIQNNLSDVNRNFMNQKVLIQETFKQISKLIKQLRPIVQKSEVDVSVLLQTFIDFCLFCKINLISIDTHFHYIFDTWTTEIIKVLKNKFQKMWSFDLFLVILDILEHPRVPQFRRALFDHLLLSFKNIFLYLTKTQVRGSSIEIEIVISRSLNTLYNIVNNLEFEDFDLLQVIHLTKKILNKLKKKMFPFLKKNGEQPIIPSFFVKYIQILLPLRFASQICSNLKLFSYFKSKVMMAFITRTSIQLFQHPLFNRRLVDFMKLLDKEHRDNLYSLVPMPSESKCILINQILCDRYHNFPEEEVIIKADFANYYKIPSFPVLILNFSAALLDLNKCVTLVDLKDTPILTTNSFTHALAIHSKLRSVKTINTLSRFFPIIKILSNIESFELDAIKTALSERLDITPYTNKSALLLFNTLGQQNCAIDHTCRAITQYILGFSTTMLKQTNKVADPQFVFVMPHVFQQLLCLKQTCQRLFELLLSTVVMVLDKMPDKTSMAQLIPTTMSQFINCIDLNLVDANLIISLKDMLREKPANDETTNQTRTKFLLQLIPVISSLLFRKEEESDDNSGIENFFDFIDSNPDVSSTTTSSEANSTADRNKNIKEKVPITFFPYILLPNVFFSKNYTKNIHVIYQKALREAFIAGGGFVSMKIIKVMHEYLRKVMNSISQPNLLSAFATIATWIDEVNNAMNNNEITSPDLFDNLKLLLEALKPVTPEQLFIDLSCLKQPINQTVCHFILKMLENDFPNLIKLTSIINTIKPLTIGQSFDLASDCWKIDWFSIDSESHISVFMRLISPAELQSLIPYFNTNEMKSIISIILNSTQLSVTFPSFMKYYILYFPRSSLSECFYTTTSFSSMMPYPMLSLYSNIEFLETANITEDALGLLKSESKSFLNSASFLQLSQFRAAKFSFLETMNDDPSHYFYALAELRSIDINLSLHKCSHLRKIILGHPKENTFPVITLPFYPESSDSSTQKEIGTRLTSFISKSHIPFLFRSSLEDEVYQCIKVMQQPDSLKTYKLEELTRISNTAWLKALDRNMMMTSNFVWRLTILNEFLLNNELANETGIIKNIQEIIDINKNLLSYLLSHSGATRDGLEYFMRSPDKKCVYVSTQNYSRVCQFLEGLFRSNKVKCENVFSIQISPSQTGLSSSKSEPWILNDTSLEKLKIKCNLLMRDFARCNLKGRKWLDALFYMFMHHYDRIVADSDNLFKRILQDLNNLTIFESQNHIAMLLCMMKKNQSLVPILNQEFPRLKVEIRLSFLKWLPQLICCSTDLPDELIHNLIRTNACIFYITFEDYYFQNIVRLTMYSNDYQDRELMINLNYNLKKIKTMVEPGSMYMRANKMNKEYQAINEYRNGMSWIQICEKDIEKFNYTVKAHKFLYEYLVKGEIPPDISSLLGFSDLKELILFCEKNPPVFKTDFKTTNYSSFNGFKFPSSTKSILSLFIENDNDSVYSGEAVLRYVTNKGDSRMLQIVSPEIYPMAQRERLFIEFISQIIDKNVSSHTRSRSTYYPFSFMVHEHLLITESHPFTSLHSAIQPISAVHQICEGALNLPEEIDNRNNFANVGEVTDSNDNDSPYDFHIRKNTNIPQKSLLWWFLQGAEGSKIDFIFMRQSFSSYFGVSSFLHFIFKSRIPTLPSLMLFKDRQKCCIPDFLNYSPRATRYITQTPLISGLLPEFVMKGSFSTSWQIIADSLSMYKDRVKIVLRALIVQPDFPNKQQIQDYIRNKVMQNQLNREQEDKLRLNVMQQLKLIQQQNKFLMMKTSSVMATSSVVSNSTVIANTSTIDKLAAIHMTEETEKCDDVFPFMFIEHLIDNSKNVLSAQPIGFAWI